MNANSNMLAMQGHNRGPVDEPVDYAKLTTERLESDYAKVKAALEELKGDEDSLPAEITDDAAALAAGAIIKRARTLYMQMEEDRKLEVEPSLRIQNACNAFFKGLRKLLQPEEKRERFTSPGLIDRIQAKIDAHQNRKEAAERERLRLEAEERRKAAEAEAERLREEQRKAAEAARAAEEARLAAERARNADRKAEKAAEAERLAKEASQRTAAVDAAQVATDAAIEKAQDARIATLAPTKEIVRTQGTTQAGAGVTLTKATEKYAILIDRAELTTDAKLALFDLFTDAEVEKAVRAYAVQTRYQAQLPGCSIGTRQKGVTR